jgi:hypothetical protein
MRRSHGRGTFILPSSSSFSFDSTVPSQRRMLPSIGQTKRTSLGLALLTLVPVRSRYVMFSARRVAKSVAGFREESFGQTKILSEPISLDIARKCAATLLSNPSWPTMHNSIVPPSFVLTLNGNLSPLSPAHTQNPTPICLRLRTHVILCARGSACRGSTHSGFRSHPARMSALRRKEGSFVVIFFL